jgi:hypothetical protein
MTIREFERDEATASHRKGTFNIDKALKEALDAILKAKPELRQTEADKKQ